MTHVGTVQSTTSPSWTYPHGNVSDAIHTAGLGARGISTNAHSKYHGCAVLENKTIASRTTRQPAQMSRRLKNTAAITAPIRARQIARAISS